MNSLGTKTKLSKPSHNKVNTIVKPQYSKINVCKHVLWCICIKHVKMLWYLNLNRVGVIINAYPTIARGKRFQALYGTYTGRCSLHYYLIELFISVTRDFTIHILCTP